MSVKILIADDEERWRRIAGDFLRNEGYQVLEVDNGLQAVEALKRDGNLGLVILDIMMPKKSGLEVLKRLRAEGCRTPILLLTAKSQVEDQVEGLDLGAADYLAKPFAMDLLLARVRAMLRRREEYTPNVLTLGDLSLNQSSFELCANGRSVVLSKLEYQLMELFMANRGTYLSSEDLLSRVWGYETSAEVGTVWVHISYLRKHLAALGSRVSLVAKRNVGYMLKDEP